MRLHRPTLEAVDEMERLERMIARHPLAWELLNCPPEALV